MKKNVLLGVSLGLNFIFAAALVLATTGAVSLSKLSKPGPQAPTSSETRVLEQALRSAGLKDAEAKRVIEALVRQTDVDSAPYAYWLSPQIRDLRARIGKIERDARARTALVEMFGAAAVDDAAFTASFRPYDSEFPMLASEKQVRLQEYRLQELKSQAESLAALVPVRSARSENRIEELLDPAERFEYMLRESALAKVLSSSAFEFTEPEFRSVFGILARENPELVASVNPVSLADALARTANQSAIIDAIGRERYDALRRARDPSYNLLRMIARVREISPDKIEQAYSLLNASDALKGGQAPANPPPELNDLLGAQSANEVFRAFQSARQQPGPGSGLTQATAHLSGKPIHAAPLTNQ